MSRAQKLIGPIDALYGAAVESVSWTDAANQLRQAFEAECLNLQVRDHHEGRMDMLATLGHPKADIDCYAAHYWDKDPWIIATRGLPVGTPYRFSDVVPEDELRKGEFYCDFLKPRCGLLRGVACNLQVDDGRVAVLGIHRLSPASDFGMRDVAAVDLLVPHLRRAILLASRWQDIERLASLASGTVDALAVGIVVTDEFGRVTLINQEAQRVVDERDGLLVKDGRPSATAPDSAAVLEAMVRAAVATAGGEPTGAPTSARIRRRRGRDLLVTVVGVSPRATGIARNRPGAAIFITDPGQQVAVAEQILAELYCLTRAEARLANLIAIGMPLESAASILSISRNTARNRLQVVYEKTGTARQSGLAALIARLGGWSGRSPASDKT